MNIIHRTSQTYEAYLTIGSIRGYNGDQIDKSELLLAISNFQTAFEIKHHYSCGVRILESEIVFQGYTEQCWDVKMVNYPRFPQFDSALKTFIMELARKLLIVLDQERITVVMPDNSILLEREDADQSRVHEE